MTEPEKAAEVKRTLEERAGRWVDDKYPNGDFAQYSDSIKELKKDVAAFAREVLEEAAMVAMGINGPGNTADQCQGYSDACREIAAAIRQMKEGW